MQSGVPPPLAQQSIPSWEPVKKQPQSSQSTSPEPSYLPLSQTLRLYAGWLLAWYGFVYLVGSFQQAGLAPWAPSFIGNLYLSPLTLHFTFATFVFLLLGTIHRGLGGGVLKGLLLTIFGAALLFGFWTYA